MRPEFHVVVRGADRRTFEALAAHSLSVGGPGPHIDPQTRELSFDAVDVYLKADDDAGARERIENLLPRDGDAFVDQVNLFERD
jgi:hypothetical protein